MSTPAPSSPHPDAPPPSPRIDAPPPSPRIDEPPSSLRPDAAPSSLRPDAPPPSPRPEPESSTEPPAPPAPAIITAVKNGKRPRHQKGRPKAKPGKLSWVHGTKKVFFASRKEEWLREAEAGRSGAFYLKMSKLYVKKYGLTMADDQDLEFDVADPPDTAADEVVHEVLSPEEQAFRAEYKKTLRTRIGNWYRAEYGSLLRSDKAAFKELFTGALDGAPAKPQRGRPIHFYSRKFYESRIKEEVEDRWERLQRRSALAEEPLPKKIDVIAKVTAELWAQETLEFQRDCELAMDREYHQALKGWEASLADSPTRTPEEIASTLKNAAYYLQPFVDAIHERFGMCATVLLAGPDGMRKGRIVMHSVHAGKTKGLSEVDWPAFDWQGFSKVESIMCAFAAECFTEAECRARVVHGVDLDDEGASGEGSARGAPSGSSGEGARSSPAPRPAATAAPSASSSSQVAAEIEGAGEAEGDGRNDRLAATAAPSASSSSQVEAEIGGAGEAEGDGRNDNDSPDEEAQNKEGAGAEAEGVAVGMYDEEWRRNDRADWTQELGRAHVAFEVGRSWGVDWARCVQKFFDFESAWGYAEGTWKMTTGTRPRQVTGWLNRGRKWTLPPALGGLLGRRQVTGQAEELWVGLFWKWWRSLQPQERAALDNGELSRPEVADWSTMAKMYGNNGLLQVMAALVWWGEVAAKRGEDEVEEWRVAVRDVTWVLEQLLESGEIEKDEEEEVEEQGDTPAKKKARKGASGTGRKRKTVGDDEAAGGNEQEGQPKKKARREKAAATEAPRRAARFRGADPEEEGSRRTRTRTA